jgi:DNA processing protein
LNNDLLYQLALTTIPNIGAVHAKILLHHYDVKDIFKAKRSELEKIEGIGTIRANSIKEFHDFSKAEEELLFIEKYKIRTLFLTEKDYPQRFHNCYDPPTLLFYKGSADLNASKMIGIVGTRNNTEYGKQVTEKLIKDLAPQNVTIVSGLAFGIDSIAHKASIKNDIPTVGALGHGLDTIYPADNAGLAKDMIRNGGGLVTEFFSKTKPDKQNFPKRNRIVAGLCDATIIVETDIRGGSMITAELANGYNRDVFAIPGKITDKKSSGSNYLIQNNKAILLTDTSELVSIMGWEEKTKKSKEKKKQKELFIELSAEEKIIVEVLNGKEAVHIDEINLRSGLSTSAIAAAILNLEFQNIVLGLPGKLYKLLT